MEKIITTIEARMGSTRLPGKMGMEIYPGLPALGAVIERLKRSRYLDDIVVATTVDQKDNILVEIAERFGAKVFRGSEEDVLGRVVGAGEIYKADILVLVTGDCLCISPKLIDEGVKFFLENEYDMVSNCIIDTYPIGIDLQVVSFKALSKSYEMAKTYPFCEDPNNFEHVNYFISRHPEIFRIYHYPAPKKYNRPDIRLALDTELDLKFLKIIYKYLYPKNENFDIEEIIEFLNGEGQKFLEQYKKGKIDD